MLNHIDQPVSTAKRYSVFTAVCGYMFATFIATSAYASDLDIYQKPTQGQKTLIMMLDTSGSMGADGSKGAGDSIWNDFAVQCTPSTLTSSTTPSYSRRYCAVDTNASNYASLLAAGRCEGVSGSSLKCYDRLTRLKDGMFSVLDNSTDPTLNDIFMGVGNFSSAGDNSSGQILVPAAQLGAVGSTQRVNLKTAISALSASNGTPSAHAYAEAAAYLMGTKTSGFGTPYTIAKQTWYKAVPGTSMSNQATYYGVCQSWAPVDLTNKVQLCNTTLTGGTTAAVNDGNWALLGTTDPGVSTANSNATINRTSNSRYSYVVYSKNYTIPKVSDANSGFTYGVLNNQTYPGIINSAQTAYLSPLPASRSQACGQGVYFLSDGQPNSSSDSEARSVMSNALNDTTANFVCPTTGNYLPNTNTGNSGASEWNCMGLFSQRLYAGAMLNGSPVSNPSGVKIQTAFVGFGKDFGSLATAVSPSDILNACRLGSRLKAGSGFPSDSCSADLPSTNPLKNPAGGYGNGVFVQATTPADVYYSVNAFIQTLGDGILKPLVTGSPTIPIDMLNSGAFQPYGYLRQIAPNPAATTTLLWTGNIKKYNITNGILVDGSSAKVLNIDGTLSTTTSDLWNPTPTTNDGGQIALGGSYSRVPMPATATPTTIRPLFTDIASVTTANVMTSVSSGAALTAVPGVNSNATTAASPTTNIPAQLGTDTNTGGVAPFTNLTLTQKLALINYLGYNLPIGTSPTAITSPLTTPPSPFLSMGGSIHAQPIQLTYSATLDSNGDINARNESVLYGSMEGALHLVNATTGVEQMVFVPSDILKASSVDPADTTTEARGLRAGEVSVSTAVSPAVPIAPTQGVDGPWVADASYKTARGTSVAGSQIVAKRMNVYGGLRMTGRVLYGLDVLTPSAPKLKFRIDNNTTGFTAMGQTWSKPAMANVRTSAGIQRVLIVGGGYDPQYESPSFDPSTNTLGNTVYMINADTGALIWSASDTNMKYSIVSRVATLDRDGDGLVDSIYYGDLGGQIWRSDFNNTYGASPFPIRTVRIADLTTTASGSTITGGKKPRFYEAPTLTVHTQGANTFVLVGAASGNRSSPLDVLDTAVGGQGVVNTLANVNNVYGIIDRDAARTDFLTAATSSMSPAATLATMQKNPQTTITGVVALAFYPTLGTGKSGWYRSLSSIADGTEKADNSFRKYGGLKAVEDLIAVTNKLYVGVYDPEGTGVPAGDPCQPRVVGETDMQQFCLPYGTCLSADGTSNVSANSNTGMVLNGTTNGNVIRAGISGLALSSIPPTGSGTGNNDCAGLAVVGNQTPVASASCKTNLIQSQWYERKPNPAKVQ